MEAFYYISELRLFTSSDKNLDAIKWLMRNKSGKKNLEDLYDQVSGAKSGDSSVWKKINEAYEKATGNTTDSPEDTINSRFRHTSSSTSSYEDLKKKWAADHEKFKKNFRKDSRKDAAVDGIMDALAGGVVGAIITRTPDQLKRVLRKKFPELSESELSKLARLEYKKRLKRNTIIGATVGGVGGYANRRIIDENILRAFK